MDATAEMVVAEADNFLANLVVFIELLVNMFSKMDEDALADEFADEFVDVVGRCNTEVDEDDFASFPALVREDADDGAAMGVSPNAASMEALDAAVAVGATAVTTTAPLKATLGGDPTAVAV